MEILFQKLFIYTICIFLINSLQAQKPTLNVKVTKSDEQKLGRTGFFKVETTELYGFSPDEYNNYHLLKSEPNSGSKYKTLIMDTYNSNLELVKSYPIDMPADADSYVTLEGLFQVDNRPLIFYSQFNKSRKARTLYFQTGALNDKKSAKKLLEFPTTDKDEGWFKPFFSNDSSKIMVVVTPPQKSSENARAKCYVYDKELKKLNDYDINYEMRFDKIRAIEYMVSNKGIPVIFVVTPKKGRSDEFGTFDENLYIYNDKTPLNYSLEVEGKAINSLKIGQEKENEISVVGSFVHSKFDKLSVLQGTVFLKLDTENGRIITKELNVFSNPVLEYFKLDEKRLARGKGMEKGVLNFVGTTKNNATVMVLDINFAIDEGYHYNVVDWHFVNQDKIVVAFDSEGKILYERVIPNYAETDIVLGLPTQVFINNNEVGIIYNTHEANLPMSGSKPIKTVDDVKPLSIYGKLRMSNGSSMINLAYIDETGRVSHYPLTNFKTEKMNLANAPAYCKNNKVVFATYDSNGFKVIQAELDYKK
jgi:hypothetical protein